LTSAIRLRKLLSEEDAQIQGYDEMEFSRRLHYRQRPIGQSLVAVRAARETSASILNFLTEDDWRRTGTHSESGPYSVDDWLEMPHIATTTPTRSVAQWRSPGNDAL
jgi:hypothetical protein